MNQPATSLRVTDLPEVRGAYRFAAKLAPTTWFQVGGVADVLFKPADTQDLADFLKALAPDIPVTVLGVGSNLIVKDGGIAGVVIKLGRGFTDIRCVENIPSPFPLPEGEGGAPHASGEGAIVEAGAAALDVHVARVAADSGRAGLEFFAGIPGTIGGAIAMNAGAYGRETTDVLVACEAVDRAGTMLRLSHADCQFSYRHFGGKEGLIFTKAWFSTTPDAPDAIHARIKDITEKREATQPVRERTGGSTFKNPEGHKAWQVIDAAGCRGLTLGGAQISPLHCNFMINTGNATAADLQALGEEVRARVKAHSGITLQWEIKRLGRDA